MRVQTDLSRLACKTKARTRTGRELELVAGIRRRSIRGRKGRRRRLRRSDAGSEEHPRKSQAKNVRGLLSFNLRPAPQRLRNELQPASKLLM